MPHDLLAIARRHLAEKPHEENEDKGGKPPTAGTLSPLSSFPSGAGPREPAGWGCHRAEADRLLAEADGYVAQSGVSGHHPAVRAAANVVVSAFRTHDIETLRFAVSEFRASVAAVIADRSRACYPHTHPTTPGG